MDGWILWRCKPSRGTRVLFIIIASFFFWVTTVFRWTDGTFFLLFTASYYYHLSHTVSSLTWRASPASAIKFFLCTDYFFLSSIWFTLPLVLAHSWYSLHNFRNIHKTHEKYFLSERNTLFLSKWPMVRGKIEFKVRLLKKNLSAKSLHAFTDSHNIVYLCSQEKGSRHK